MEETTDNKSPQLNDSENNQLLIDEIYSKPPKKNYSTNKTDVCHNDHLWSLDILDFKNYGPEKTRRYRYVLVVIDNFSKFGLPVPLKSKNA